MPQSILPIQNLGEIAHIMQRRKEAFTLLDMCIKLYKNLDWQNLLKFKALTMLGSLLDSQGDTESMRKIHETIFKGLEKATDSYELVFVTRNYGYLLAANDATRLEGQDYIKQAEEMQKAFPYWSERKMGLFVPIMSTLEDSQYGL